MQLKSVLVFLLSLLTFFSKASPLKAQELPPDFALRRRVAYSVVAVDGSSISKTPPLDTLPIQTIIHISDQTKTVTAPASTPPATKTVVSTLTGITSDVSTSTSRSLYIVVNAGETTSSPTVRLVTRTSRLSTTVNCTSPSSSSTSTPRSFASATPSTTSKSKLTTAIPLDLPQYAKTTTETAPPAEAEWVTPAAFLPPPSSSIISQSTLQTKTPKTYNDGMWHTTWRTWNTTSTTSLSLTTTATATGALGYWKK